MYNSEPYKVKMMLFLSWFEYVINFLPKKKIVINGGISKKNVILIHVDMSNARIN